MKWIRWSGLIVFICISGLIIGFLALFLDPLLKQGIEYAGTKMVGAKVELRAVNTSLLSGKMQLNGLLVTNPKAPMSNAFEIEQATFDLQLTELLAKRVSIEELSVQGLFVNTPREQSGAIEEQPEKDAAESQEITIPGVNLPSKDEILAKAELKSIDEAKALQDKVAKLETSLKAKIANLPDKSKVDDYKKRLKALTKGGKDPLAYVRKAKDIKQLKREIDADIDQIKAVKNSVKKEISAVKAEAKRLKDLPNEDLKRLLKQVGVGEDGQLNIVSALFGDKIGGWFKDALYWYERIEPYIAATEAESDGVEVTPDVLSYGRIVKFPTTVRKPDFHLKKMVITKPVDQNKPGLIGNASHISSAPSQVPQPMQIDLQGEALEKINKAVFKAILDHRKLLSLDAFDLSLSAIALKELEISKSEKLPLSIASSQLDLISDIDIQGGELSGSIAFKFNEASMLVGEKDSDNDMEKIIKSTLKELTAFTIDVGLSGKITDPSFSIRSDLDDQLKKSTKRIVNQKLAELKSSVKSTITERLAVEQKSLQEKLSGLGQFEGLIDGKESDLKSILKSIKL